MPRTDARRVILELIRKADGEFTGKTRLFKAFYFSHLYYYEKSPGLLTDWPIARMPQGPGIHKSESLFQELQDEGWLSIERIHEGPYPEFRYRLTEKAKRDLVDLPEDAARAIQAATDFVHNRSGSALSQLTHDYSRSWLQGVDGEILNIYIDLIPDDEYQRRNKDLEELQGKLAEILGD